MKASRAVEVLRELRERGDVYALGAAKRGLKVAELNELVSVEPALAYVLEPEKGAKLYGITGYGQRFLQEKEGAK